MALTRPRAAPLVSMAGRMTTQSSELARIAALAVLVLIGGAEQQRLK